MNVQGYWANCSPFMRLAGESVDASRERLVTWDARAVRVRVMGSWGDNVRYEDVRWLVSDPRGGVGLFDASAALAGGIQPPEERPDLPLVWRIEWVRSIRLQHGAWRTDYRSDGRQVVTVPGRPAVAVLWRDRYGVRYHPDGRTERLSWEDPAVVAVLEDVARRKRNDPHREFKRRLYSRW